MGETAILTDEGTVNEKRMCADCLGYGRVGNHTCTYCNGTGRVLTYCARVLREQREKRIADAAPALYEAVKELIGVEYRHGSRAKREAEFLAAVEKGRAALVLVDDPKTSRDKGEGTNEQLSRRSN
jgi:hypothetical protein